MAKGLLTTILEGIFDEIFDAEWVGKRGEKLTEKELKKVSLFGRKGKVLRNIYLPKDNGETSELDVVFITQKGIFIFESKNYSGWIFGNEDSQKWTVMLPNRTKNSFYNPIKQNRTHLKWMRKYVGDDVPLFSIIVFSERCELKKVEMKSSEIKVIKRDRTYATVRDIWDVSPDTVSEEKAEKIYESLKKLTNQSEAVKAEHVKTIERKYHPAAEKPLKDTDDENAIAYTQYIPDRTDIIQKSDNTETDEESHDKKTLEEFTDSELISRSVNAEGIHMPIDMEATGKPEGAEAFDMVKCNKCGGKMILRTARKGANAGNCFWGCENFPKCRCILPYSGMNAKDKSITSERSN